MMGLMFRSTGVEYLQPYLRLLRVNGDKIDNADSVTLLQGQQHDFVLSVNPMPANVAEVGAALILISDGSTLAPQPSAPAAMGSLLTFNLPNTVASDVYLLRVTWTSNGTVRAACELEVTIVA